MPVAARSALTRRVLIIDDEPDLIEGLTEALNGEFQILTASDTGTAESLLTQEPADLIILDVVLRHENGLDFLTKLRQKSDVPVLIITGFGSKEVVLAAMRARANDYLDKPFTLSQLYEKVRDLTAAGHRPDHVADRVREIIEQEYMRDWTVEELANALHLSVRTMRLAFRRKYGRRLTDFLEETRIRRAQDLLATTDFLRWVFGTAITSPGSFVNASARALAFSAATRAAKVSTQRDELRPSERWFFFLTESRGDFSPFETVLSP
jgi:DNA-binding response OmpR family regulator